MRLQLTFVLVLGTLIAGATVVEADPPTGRVGAESLFYADSDATLISTTRTTANATKNGYSFGARYLLDVVSSASIDVVSQASERIGDIRHEVGGELGASGRAGALRIAYARSRENDFSSHNASLRAETTTRDDRFSIGMTAGFSSSRITQAGAFGFLRHQTTYRVSASFAWTPTRRDALSVVLSFVQDSGFLSSPYRALTINGLPYFETYPDQRSRFATGLLWNHALGDRLTLRMAATIYGDTFGVAAGTVRTELVHERGPLSVGASLRLYGQSGARFFETTYRRQQRFMSVDKELSAFVDVFVAGSVAYSIEHEATRRVTRLGLSVSGFYFHYMTFATLHSRVGLLSSAGVTIDF